jgi:hypothetical protein
VSRGERFDAKKHPSFIFTLSGPKQQNNYKTHRQLDVRYPAKLLQRHDHLCTRMEDLHKKKVSERERERERNARVVGGRSQRTRAREKRERVNELEQKKGGEIGSIFFTECSLSTCACAHRNTLEIKKKRRMNRRTVVSFRLFRQFGLEHALRSLREFTHFSKIVTTGLKNKTKERENSEDKRV